MFIEEIIMIEASHPLINVTLFVARTAMISVKAEIKVKNDCFICCSEVIINIRVVRLIIKSIMQDVGLSVSSI